MLAVVVAARRRCRDGIGIGGGGEAAKRKRALVGAWMLFCSRCCTRGCRRVLSELPHEMEVYTSVYREMAADFVKYSSHPVVADGTSHTLVAEMFVQAACFPDYSRDTANEFWSI